MTVPDGVMSGLRCARVNLSQTTRVGAHRPEAGKDVTVRAKGFEPLTAGV